MLVLSWHSCPRKLWATSPLGSGLHIRTFSYRFEHSTIAIVVCMPNSIRFSHGYSKTSCLPHFPVSSQQPHCSLLTLAARPSDAAWPGHQVCSEVTEWAVLLSCCCSAQRHETLAPSPVLHLWLAACVLLPGWSFFAPSPASYFVSHPPAKVFLLPSVPYSCNFQPPVVFHSFNLSSDFFQSMFKDTAVAF